MTITKARAQQRAFWIIDKSRDGLGFSKRRLEVRDYAQLMGWDNKSQTQYLGIKQFHCSRNPMAPLRARLKGDTLPWLSDSQLLAGLGNSFSVPVFQAIAENMLKCFNGLKMSSDSEDSDSDSVAPVKKYRKKSSVGQGEQFTCRTAPVKKQKLPQYRKISGYEETVDQQTALERDAKCQRRFKTTK